MSWRMVKVGEKIDTYGFIISGVPIYTDMRPVGYKLVIQTPYWFQYGESAWYPVFISFMDTSKNQELYRWFKFCQSQKMKYKMSKIHGKSVLRFNPAPIHVTAKKRGSYLYENEWKHRDNEDVTVYKRWWVKEGYAQPQYIMWVFIYKSGAKFQTLVDGIPKEELKIKKVFLDEARNKALNVDINI